MVDELTGLFLELASIPSPSGDERKVGECIIRQLKGHADIVKFDSYGNVFAHLDGKGRPLFLSAHMDTVKPAETARPRVKGRYIYADGKGVLGSDNKAAIAAIVMLFRELKRKGTVHVPIDVAFTCSEEYRSSGAANFDYSLIKAREGFTLDANMPVGNIIVASPYYNGFNLEIIGKGAHASRPEIARNALLAFNSLLNGIELGRINGETVANIGMVRSGEVRNAIPATLTAHGEVRSFERKEINRYMFRLVRELYRISRKHGVSFKLHSDRVLLGYKYGRSSREWKLVDLARRSMARERVKPKIVSPWESTDASVFLTKGIRTIVLADGPENAHTVKERLRISELRSLTNVLMRIVTENQSRP